MMRPSNLINKYLEMSAEDKTMFDSMYSLIKKKHSIKTKQKMTKEEKIPITEKEIEDFTAKITEGYNRVVPKHLRENKHIDKVKEKSFAEWVKRLRNRLRY